jgi:hypothetical protein
MRILCLDIDDCIFPSNNSYFGRLDDALDILKLNMKRITMMLEKYDMQVYITSSWYMIMGLDDNGNLSYTKAREYELGDDFYKEEYQAFQIMKPVLDGNVVGLSKGCRYSDIARLLNEGLVVVSFDDMDLSPEKILEYGDHVDDTVMKNNYQYVELTGFITNRQTYIVDKFMRNHGEWGGKGSKPFKHFQRH